MKKFIQAAKTFLVLAGTLSIVSGCGKETLPNTYIEGSDFQYMQTNGTGDYTDIQQGENGYYFRHNDYIYYMDNMSREIQPLCNRVDCLHDKETEPERKANCNAYVKKKSDCSRGISYCNGSVYCLDGVIWYDHGDTQTLYRISANGSKKEKVYTWADDRRIPRWIIHRDILYYTEQKFTKKQGAEETEVIETQTLYAMDLTKPVLRPKELYTINSEEIIEPVITHLKCFGNYMYFWFAGFKVMESDGKLHLFATNFVYDMEKQELKELRLSGMQEDEYVNFIDFWQGRLLCKVIKGYDNDYFKQAVTYIANLDGTDAEVYIEDIMGHTYCSDGTYLIKTDAGMVFMASLGYLDYDKEESTFWVYDNNLDLVDSFVLPPELKKRVIDIPRLGNAEASYTLYDDSEDPYNAPEPDKWGVLRWDKSGIGSYGGGELDVTVIPYVYDGD